MGCLPAADRAMRYQLAALLTVAATALVGCSSTMNKDECRTVDWRTIGYEDGVVDTRASGLASIARPAPNTA